MLPAGGAARPPSASEPTALSVDDRHADPVQLERRQHPVEDLPAEYAALPARQPVLRDRHSVERSLAAVRRNAAGWERVQAICDFVHHHVTFGYGSRRADPHRRRDLPRPVGVCRDYTHLAVTFCRCMNIPARYCTGDIASSAAAALPRRWLRRLELAVYLGGHELDTVDPRNNAQHIERDPDHPGPRRRRRAADPQLGPSCVSAASRSGLTRPREGRRRAAIRSGRGGPPQGPACPSLALSSGATRLQHQGCARSHYRGDGHRHGEERPRNAPESSPRPAARSTRPTARSPPASLDLAVDAVHHLLDRQDAGANQRRRGEVLVVEGVGAGGVTAISDIPELRMEASARRTTPTISRSIQR